MSAPVVVKSFPLDKEYAKQTGVTAEDVATLRAWLSTQPHLPGDLITDLELASAYYCCKCSIEVSKQVLDLHFSLKTLFQNLFKDFVVTPKILNTLNATTLLPLKMRAHDGSVVLYCQVLDSDPKKYIFTDTVRVALMVMELWQEEEGTWPGVKIVFDMKNYTLQHLAKVDLITVQQLMYYLQEAMLVKVTGIHYINASSFIDKVMMMTKPFLKSGLLSQLFVHQAGSSSFEKHVPLEALPEEAGGSYISVMKGTANLQERLKLNKEFFERRARRRVDEAKRPGKPKTMSDIFGGIEGSFKKLDID